jgi:predicted transposase YbfD/YdcC
MPTAGARCSAWTSAPRRPRPSGANSCAKLRRRGLRGVKLVVSDAHEGIKAAVAKLMNATWQRCRVHTMRNALAHAGKSSRRVVSAFMATAFAQDNADAAKAQWRRVADQLRPKLPKLSGFMDEAEDDVLAYMGFPADHWPKIHSTNGLERLNGEIKRRTDVVGIFPNDQAIIRLVGAILLEQNDEWAVQRARYMTLETMAAVSDDAIVGLPTRPMPENADAQLPATPRLGTRSCLLAVKANQPTLRDEIDLFFKDAEPSLLSHVADVDKGHGRIETRTVTVAREVDWLGGERRFPGELRLPDVAAIVRVESKAELKDRCRFETRYYVASAPLSAQAAAGAIRGHWGMEKQLHWVLDVVFNEDQSRLRKGHDAANMAIVRHFAINQVRTAPEAKRAPRPTARPRRVNPSAAARKTSIKLRRNIPDGTSNTSKTSSAPSPLTWIRSPGA